MYYSIIKQVAHRDRNGGSSAPDRWLILAQIIYGMFLCIPGWHEKEYYILEPDGSIYLESGSGDSDQLIRRLV